ncbi:hypothetical protein C8A01DRAFT_41470 [Parachaetomium inaequale]|uniref:Uncharacterized protein n=1 Tax=Parachaetomium inaequale TaxID=2588326 RepID=A0AAN6P5K7_9PEZI|nr:hypothetical protein C8A01DRAFT_41470 [Parachaetomium inaequale]
MERKAPTGTQGGKEQFSVLHCTKARDYDSPDGYSPPPLLPPRPGHGQPDQDPDEPAWYSRNYRKTLHSMCLVSKRFGPLAQTVLYHEFIPGYGDAWRSAEFSWDGRLASFVRTMAARPDLAALVKRVYVHCYLLRPVTEEEAQAALDNVIGPTAHEYLAHFERKRSAAYERAELRMAALKTLGLLLALVPNLERFSLQIEGPNGGIPAGALSTLATLLQAKPLLKLKTLDICDRSLPFPLDYHAGGILEAVASAGTLTTLNLHMCASTALDLGRGRLRIISAVRITRSRISAGDLASLFDSCAAPTLKSFVYEATYPDVDTSTWRALSQFWRLISMSSFFSTIFLLVVGPVREAGGSDHFKPSDAIQHLKRHKATLESLHLDLRGFGFMPSLDGGDAQPLSETLKDFTALRHVFISASMLYNHHGRASYTNYDSALLTRLLPPTVTSLNLTGNLSTYRDTSRLAHALLYLAKPACPRKQFSALRRVRCDTTQAGDGLVDYAVGEAFAARGVDFGYESCPLSEPTLREGERTPCGPWSQNRGLRARRDEGIVACRNL